MLHKTSAAVCHLYVPECTAVLLLWHLLSSFSVDNNHKFNHVRKSLHDFKRMRYKMGIGSKSKCKVNVICKYKENTNIETLIISRWWELIICMSASLIRSPLVDTSILLPRRPLLPANASSHVAGKSYKWIIHSDLHVSILTLDTDRKSVSVNVMFVLLSDSAVQYFIYMYLTWGEWAGS